MRTIEGKVVLLGSQGVGKTSMITRYVGKKFSKHANTTIGASFFTCKVNLDEARVKLQVWDTAGEERFRSMAPMYYRNANAAILVFDLTQYETFDIIKTWVTELQRNVEEAMVLALVGNKSDLADKRKIDPEEGRKYANKIGASYHETSALQDEGIEQVFFATALGLVSLSNGNHDTVTSLRIFESTTSSSPSSPDLLQQHSPSSEESFAHTSIAFGINERPPACC